MIEIIQNLILSSVEFDRFIRSKSSSVLLSPITSKWQWFRPPSFVMATLRVMCINQSNYDHCLVAVEGFTRQASSVYQEGPDPQTHKKTPLKVVLHVHIILLDFCHLMK